MWQLYSDTDTDADAESSPSGANVRHTMSEHRDWIRCLALCSTNSWLASGSDDLSVRLWSLETLREMSCLHSLEATSISSLNFSSSGRSIGACSDAGTVLLLDVRTQHRALELTMSCSGHAVCIGGANEQLLFCAGNDAVVRVWDTRKLERTPLHRLEGHSGSINSLCRVPSGLQIVSGSDDATLRVWNTVTGECEHVLELRHQQQQQAEIVDAAVHKDGVTVASVSTDLCGVVWAPFDPVVVQEKDVSSR